MKLSVQACFDLGLSVGIDDTSLYAESLERFRRESLQTVIFPISDLPIFATLAMGTGLRVILDNGDVPKVWLQAAFEKSDGRTQNLFAEASISQCYLDIYSIGTAFIRLDIDRISAFTDDDQVAFYACFEHAGYEKVTPLLKQICLVFLRCFRSDNDLARASLRFDLNEADPYNLIPGFTCVVICDDSVESNQPTIDRWQEFERQYAFQDLVLDEGLLHLGWACGVLERPLDPRDAEGILYLLQIAQVFWSTCASFEQMFARHLSEFARHNLNRSSGRIDAALDVRFLQDLRTLAGIVIELTTYSSTTSNISHLFFYDAFERLGKLRVKHQRIRTTCELFYTIQSELVRISEAARAQTFQRLGFFITSLTSVPAMKVLVDTVDPELVLWPSGLLRALLMLAPAFLLLIGLVVWKAATAIYISRKQIARVDY